MPPHLQRKPLQFSVEAFAMLIAYLIVTGRLHQAYIQMDDTSGTYAQDGAQKYAVEYASATFIVS